MNKQEIFDIAVRGIRKQGKPSYADNSCLYKSEDGLMCALGQVLVPKGCYDPDMENTTPTSFPSKGRRALDEMLFKANIEDSYDMRSFLAKLQLCHDDVANPGVDPEVFIDEFLARAEKLASAHNLNAGACND